jgi:hypothetical protein
LECIQIAEEITRSISASGRARILYVYLTCLGRCGNVRYSKSITMFVFNTVSFVCEVVYLAPYNNSESVKTGHNLPVGDTVDGDGVHFDRFEMLHSACLVCNLKVLVCYIVPA